MVRPACILVVRNTTSPKNEAIRGSVQKVVAAAWGVYEKYIPYWTSFSVWFTPLDLQPWIRSEKTRLIDEAGESARERMIDVEEIILVDFDWDQGVGN